MHISNVIETLKKKYPGKTIILNNKREVTEILCEVEPTVQNKKQSTAIAVIDKTVPHYHKKATEIYTIIEGELTMIIDGRRLSFPKNASVVIRPGQVHEAFGDEVWVKVVSRPGWSKKDHFIQTTKQDA